MWFTFEVVKHVSPIDCSCKVLIVLFEYLWLQVARCPAIPFQILIIFGPGLLLVAFHHPQLRPSPWRFGLASVPGPRGLGTTTGAQNTTTLPTTGELTTGDQCASAANLQWGIATRTEETAFASRALAKAH